MKLRTTERLVAAFLIFAIAGIGVGLMWLLAAFTDTPPLVVMLTCATICALGFVWVFWKEIFK